MVTAELVLRASTPHVHADIIYPSNPSNTMDKGILSNYHPNDSEALEIRHKVFQVTTAQQRLKRSIVDNASSPGHKFISGKSAFDGRGI